MSQQIRIFLKAIAVGRYLISNQRLSKLSSSAKSFVAGQKSITEMAKEVIPVSSHSFHSNLRINVKKRVGIYVVALSLAGIISYEYFIHRSYVPITDRKHFVIIPREMELHYQTAMLRSIEKQIDAEHEKDESICILDPDDDRVQYIISILRRLQDACIYFSPECGQYMKQMKVIVVNDDSVNAYTTMGSVLVVYTGLINHFKQLKASGDVYDLDECIAGVLAHELSHSMSRHPVESMLRWTGLAYYVYISLIPDLVVMPIIKGFFDKRRSRAQEHEADFQALYLLKRSGYDPSSMIKTLSLLPEDEEDIELVSIAKESIDDHPRIISRVTHLQNRIFWFEKDFRNRFEVTKSQKIEKIWIMLMDFCLFALVW